MFFMHEEVLEYFFLTRLQLDSLLFFLVFLMCVVFFKHI